MNTGGGADNKRMIKTESGTRLPASFKSERYSDWVNKSKVDRISAGTEEDSRSVSQFRGKLDERRKFLHHASKRGADDEGVLSFNVCVFACSTTPLLSLPAQSRESLPD